MSGLPQTVTLDVVPVRRESPTLEYVEVDREVVAWNAEREELHRLDPIASLVFLLCDGVTPLRVTVDELAATFGQPVDRVRADVLALVTSLARDGLVGLDRA